MKQSPNLYWYLSQTTSSPVLFALEDPRQPKPLLEMPLETPICPGVQVIRLGDYGIELEEGVVYRWHISLIVDSQSRSKDIHAAALIERVPQGEHSVGQCEPGACLDGDPPVFGYDGVQVSSEQIAAHPSDHMLRLMRASLLEQVGLDDVAEQDRTQTAMPCSARPS